jgi:mono/diheme cytochrome c family protein
MISNFWIFPLKSLAGRTSALMAMLFFAGCKSPLPPSKPLAELSPQETSGYQVYQGNCARCHLANSESGMHGPGLQGLYKKPYLPSGAPANDERIASAIVHGRGMMPAFGNNFDDQQLSDLIAYLHTL